jgi:CRP-like cAMP-binding protein
MMSDNFLSKIPVFSDLPEDELDHLQSMLQVKTLQPGEILFREGEIGEHFYVLTEGELEILLGIGTEEELLLNMLGPGEYLGEMSLVLPGGERTATARAREKAVLLSMSRMSSQRCSNSIPCWSNRWCACSARDWAPPTTPPTGT